MPTTTHENLPNVVIRNIILENDDDLGTKTNIVVDVVVKYEKQSDWISDEFLLKHLSLMVVKSSNTSFNHEVTNGNIVIDAKTIALYSEHSDDIVVKQTPLASKKQMLMENETNECLMTFKFKHSGESDSVDLFAMTMVNISDISYSYGVNLEKTSMKSYQGPLVSESVFRNGQVVTTSNVMRLDDGTLYYGPYHAHSSGYMVGSKHSPNPHATLTAESVPNIKLKDNRNIKHPTNNLGPSDTDNNAIFTDLDTTISDARILTGMFSIDINSIILTRTKYGRLFFNLNEEIYARLVDQIKIKKIKIYKRKVRQSKRTKKISKFLSRDLLIESYDSDPGVFNNRVKIESLASTASPSEEYLKLENFNETVQPVHLGSNWRKKSYIREEHVQILADDRAKYVRTFSFVDANIYNSRQPKCMYEVDVTLSDSSIPLLQEIIDEITLVMIDLKRYISLATSPNNYDYRGKRIQDSFQSRILDIYSGENFPWIKSVALYVKYYSILKNISQVEQEQMRDRYHNFLSPKSFNIRSARSFLQKYNDFVNDFKKYFKTNYKGLDNLTSQRTQRIYQKNSFSDIEINSIFPSVIDLKKTKSGHEYLIYDSPTILNRGFGSIIRMSKQEFFERVKLEATRFPGKKESSDNYVSYLSPLTYILDGEKISLDNSSPITYKRMFNQIQNDNNIPTTPSFQSIGRPTIGSLNPTTMLENILSRDINYVKAADYLGSRYGVIEDTQDREFPTDSYSEMFNAFLLTIQNRIIPFGAINTQSLSDHSTMQEIYYKETRYNILESPENLNLFEMLMSSVQVVEYRQKMIRGTSMKHSPWTRLTTSAFNTLSGEVVCRLRPWTSVFLPESNIDAFNAYNNLFIISFPVNLRQDSVTPSVTSIMLERDSQAEDLDYMTSNPILQPENRSGINSDFKYSPLSLQTSPEPLGSPSAPPGYSEPQSIAEVMGSPTATNAQASGPSPTSTTSSPSSGGGGMGGMGGGGGSYGY